MITEKIFSVFRKIVLHSLKCTQIMATKKIEKTVSEQIKEALDGRTQRWLALKIGMSEDKLSNKLKGLTDFLKEELELINSALNTKF